MKIKGLIYSAVIGGLFGLLMSYIVDNSQILLWSLILIGSFSIGSYIGLSESEKDKEDKI